jgi:citrate lyase subunit beta/citryl-CoA lyase
VRDDEGLRRSCEHGRALGHLGRTAIHPSQLPIIEQAYLPSGEELSVAQATLERLGEESGAAALAGGELVDEAMRSAALAVVAIADRYGTSRAS